jgi:hypothetical protein
MALVTPKRLNKTLTVAHRRSKRQEREVAQALGGKCTPASGALDVKGDVRITSIARVECKTTANKSFSVTREIIQKIEDAAIGSGEVPALVVEFISSNGAPESSVAVVPMWVLQSIIANGAN